MNEHPNYKIIGIEQPFDFSYDETHSLNGKIDRVILDESTGKLIIQFFFQKWIFIFFMSMFNVFSLTGFFKNSQTLNSMEDAWKQLTG